MHPAVRAAAVAVSVIGLAACDRVFTATAAERVGYLRELVRARTVSRDSVPLDACSVSRFMDGMVTWRDSLLPAERAHIAESPVACPSGVHSVEGRFVLTRWYRNWSGEYVIRGASASVEQGYRFTDGVFVGREQMKNSEYVAGIAPKAPAGDSSRSAARPTNDSIRRAGTLADTTADSSAARRADSSARSTPRPVR